MMGHDPLIDNVKRRRADAGAGCASAEVLSGEARGGASAGPAPRDAGTGDAGGHVGDAGSHAGDRPDTAPAGYALGEAEEGELDQVLGLYRHLHANDPILEPSAALQELWRSIWADPNIRLVVARSAGEVVSTCTLVIVPNLTRGARPYGLIENVITHPDHRRKGIGTAVVHHALGIAWGRGCYKVMLLTSSTSESTWRFYERAGFLRGIKTGFIAYPG